MQAPLAGGASTPELAAAVSDAGGLGFLAAGYKTPDDVRQDIRRLRSLTERSFGVNIFAPPQPVHEAGAVDAYAAELRSEAERYGARLGDARHDDDSFEAKLSLVREERVEVVSFTFGCPERSVVEGLHADGCDVWVTVTNPDEAAQAQEAGADALVVQGFEAGGHRAHFRDVEGAEDLGLIVALRLVASRVDVPLIAAGGLADGASVAAALCAGAVAAQLGTALMLSSEAGTAEPQRELLAAEGPTRLTRAFTGRAARGLVNRFMEDHDAAAPIAYPDVHHLTAPIRAAARRAGDAGGLNLWAGQSHSLARSEPAAAIVRRVGEEARDTIRRAATRFGASP